MHQIKACKERIIGRWQVGYDKVWHAIWQYQPDDADRIDRACKLLID